MNFFLSLLNAMPGAVAQGLIWGIMAIGVYITYRILDVADLTVDGSLATGGAVCVMLMRAGWNPWAGAAVRVSGGCAGGTVSPVCSTPGAAFLPFWPVSSPSWRCTPSICGSWTGKANQPIGVDKYDLLVSQRYVRDLSAE